MEQKDNRVGNAANPENEIVPPPPRKRVRKWWVLAGLAVLVITGAVFFYYLRFLAPYESTDDAFVEGYVTMIGSRVPGQVAKLLATDNQEVREGDLLAEIDPRDYEARLSRARADLAAARSQLDQSQAQVKVSEAKAGQAQAAAPSPTKSPGGWVGNCSTRR